MAANGHYMGLKFWLFFEMGRLKRLFFPRAKTGRFTGVFFGAVILFSSGLREAPVISLKRDPGHTTRTRDFQKKPGHDLRITGK